jgi:exopolysaccharide biosynthesis polyprenyl glycosylphosphotransferase
VIATPRTQLVARTLTLVALDVAALYGAWYLATNWRFGSYWGLEFRIHQGDALAAHAAIFGLFSMLFEAYDPRRPYARGGEISRLVAGYLMAGLVELLFFFFRMQPEIGRGVFVLNVGLFIAFATAGRVLYSSIGSDYFKRRALVVTAGDVGATLLAELKRAAASAYDIVGYVAPARDLSAPNTAPWLGDGTGLMKLIADRRIETVIVSSNVECWHRHIYDLMLARHRGIELVDFARTCERFLNRIPCEHVSELWLLWGLMGRSSFYVMRLKRLVDVVLGLVLLVPALPVMAVIAIAIKLTSHGPVLYTQDRIGQHHRTFQLLKFRSMVEGAEDDSGPVWAKENDPRVTPVGRLLRRWRLDELPQLFNVIKGDMSLVGPRPERGVFVSELLQALPMYEQRHALRPGLTGWGQIHYNYAASTEQSREKLEYDLFYVKNASLLLDLAILLRTTRTLVGGQGR